MRWAPGYECGIRTVCSFVIVLSTGRPSVLLSRAGLSALHDVIVLISCIGVFIMMWMILSVCTATVAAAKTWTLRQGWYGLSWSCVGGAAPFLRDHPDSFRVATMPWHSLPWNFPPELVLSLCCGVKKDFLGWVAFLLAGLTTAFLGTAALVASLWSVVFLFEIGAWL